MVDSKTIHLVETFKWRLLDDNIITICLTMSYALWTRHVKDMHFTLQLTTLDPILWNYKIPQHLFIIYGPDQKTSYHCFTEI